MRKPVSETGSEKQLVEVIKETAKPLDKAEDLDPLVKASGGARIVMLGEASHGTSEFYTWRAELTKRLIREKGFRFIAVEGDWPSCYELNRWVKGETAEAVTAEELLSLSFRRWPSWMWANREVAELMVWLRDWNKKLKPEEQVGFYGLDVYSLWESIDEVLGYVRRKGDEALTAAAEKAFECFQGYGRDEQRYAVSTAYLDASCEDEVVDLLGRLRRERVRMEAAGAGGDAAFSAEINALVAANAEHYYRTMVGGDAESWNIRDEHMAEVLAKLMEYHGPEAKAVIWEHNTHVGDARATDMLEDGMVNVGQLVRERFERSFAVGFSTYRGSVLAGSSWGAPVQTMPVPEAWKNSWDELLHRAGGGNKLLLFGESSSSLFEDTRGQRAIGVVYRPQSEWGNYVPTSLSKRYDALLYLEETKALSFLQQREPALV
ncbi:erythromycin esterase family protein [Gorillibacterium sp. sgz5001074]|uniref:erythromycin esterase family protein n=1 Tax=Gorillibacterium sp. sgz5001074 TaxID=3446695 RepID=UPI003F671961